MLFRPYYIYDLVCRVPLLCGDPGAGVRRSEGQVGGGPRPASRPLRAQGRLSGVHRGRGQALAEETESLLDRSDCSTMDTFLFFPQVPPDLLKIFHLFYSLNFLIELIKKIF